MQPMNRSDYILILKENIKSIDEQRQIELIQYYTDYLEELNNDDQIIEILGKPEDLAKKIIENNKNESNDLSKNQNTLEEINKEKEPENKHTKYNDSLYFEFKKSDIRNIEFNFGAANVVLILGKKVSVETRGLEKHQLLCKISSDRTLVVKNLDKLSRLNFFNHNRSTSFVPRILITLPKSMIVEKFSVVIGAGRFDARGVSVTSQKTMIEVGAASFKFDKINAKNTKIHCGMGKILINGIFTKRTDIDCGMGSVTLNLQGNKQEYSYDAKVGLGIYKFNNEKYDGVNKIVPNSILENHFSVNCGIGSVVIKLDSQ